MRAYFICIFFSSSINDYCFYEIKISRAFCISSSLRPPRTRQCRPLAGQVVGFGEEIERIHPTRKKTIVDFVLRSPSSTAQATNPVSNHRVRWRNRNNSIRIKPNGRLKRKKPRNLQTAKYSTAPRIISVRWTYEISRLFFTESQQNR